MQSRKKSRVKKLGITLILNELGKTKGRKFPAPWIYIYWSLLASSSLWASKNAFINSFKPPSKTL